MMGRGQVLKQTLGSLGDGFDFTESPMNLSQIGIITTIQYPPKNPTALSVKQTLRKTEI